ncbi:MAG: GTPase [Planctomycetota bacterium]|jgi:hypothetical protein
MAETADSHLTRLARAAGAELLAGMGFDWGPLDGNVCAALRFKRQPGDTLPIVGLVGGASSGKSTLFNSLLGREVSRISAHAHETLGPVAAVPDGHAQRFESWTNEGVLFASLKRDRCGIAEVSSGRVGAVCIYRHDVASLADVILLDLPDVTSKMSADQGSTTRTLLPWFDGLVVVADEERWFDAAVFDETAELARNFGPRLWVVFNRTERTEPLNDEDRQKLADHAEKRRAAGSYVSPFQPGSGYRPVSADTRQRVTSWLGDLDARNRDGELERHLQRRCGDVVRTNVTRSEQFGELCRSVDRELDSLRAETRLSADLLTDQERALLGLGRRFLPLYDLYQNLWRRATTLRLRVAPRGLKPAARGAEDRGVDFEKRTDALAEVLRRNLEHRFNHATDRTGRIISDSPYLADAEHGWSPTWSLPSFDEREWATRIRAHIEAWKAETAKQSRRGDIVALSLGMPLLLADLLFLGGAGFTLTWATAWVAGLLGGKSLASLVQRSPAFQAYQTTVRAYQSFIREALTDQWEANLAAMPRRHLPMSDPLLESVM